MDAVRLGVRRKNFVVAFVEGGRERVERGMQKGGGRTEEVRVRRGKGRVEE